MQLNPFDLVVFVGFIVTVITVGRHDEPATRRTASPTSWPGAA